ncbi:SGNH/GDSL hydrolase family protein [Eubacteriales bacterium OttesenSCG-928-G02]|nr:SGNH/GDSL hydrolase family protein [Eubacteriales bacterium OttesenSCG-928-G02]
MNIKDFNKNTTILMSGDSVTDCNRARPYGTYRYGLGTGYVLRMHEMLQVLAPEKEIKLVNAGISGETSRNVKNRWINDLEQVKPDYATLMIGVNDIWRKYDCYLDKGEAVDAAEYEENLRFIIEESLKTLKGFMLISPFYIELNKKDAFMNDIITYTEICKNLSAEYKIDFCDMQAEMNRLQKHLYTSALSPDRVHPNGVTHFAIARKILKDMNLKF